MGRYDIHIALESMEDIRRLLGDVEIKVEHEIQDAGAFLLLKVKFQQHPSAEEMETWREALKMHFSEIFVKPSKESEEGYSWMIVFMHKEIVIFSVMDDIVTTN